MASRNVEHIEPALVKEWIDSGEARLIDVREAYEHQARAIPNSELYPLSSFDPDSIVPTSQKTLFYCRSGQRSAQAAAIWSAHHKVPSYNLKGGILAFENYVN